MLVNGEDLIGGWAEVYRSDHDVPVRAEVTFGEYVGKKQGGSINKQWTEKPATMIRKVALVQAHREAFPNQFEGMYSPEEMNVEVDNIEYKADQPATGYKPPMSAPQEKSSSSDKPAREKLKDELELYCSTESGTVDVAKMQETIIKVSSFGTAPDIKSFTVDDMFATRQDGSYKISDKWIGTAIGNLRKLAEAA
jgi:hypothetical protein